MAIVDDEDFERISKYKWHISNNTSVGRILPRAEVGRKTVRRTLAQEVMNTSLMYDHKDRNFLNNAKNNLRICNNSTNAVNKSKLKNCSSKYKGVRWHSRAKKWYAQIKKNQCNIHLGSFDDETLAGKAYDTKAKELYGEFAVLNFPS